VKRSTAVAKPCDIAGCATFDFGHELWTPSERTEGPTCLDCRRNVRGINSDLTGRGATSSTPSMPAATFSAGFLVGVRCDRGCFSVLARTGAAEVRASGSTAADYRPLFAGRSSSPRPAAASSVRLRRPARSPRWPGRWLPGRIGPQQGRGGRGNSTSPPATSVSRNSRRGTASRRAAGLCPALQEPSTSR
jgi:hypothetical protein